MAARKLKWMALSLIQRRKQKGILNCFCLKRQVKYVLIPAQYAEVNGKRKCIERECTYISDFTYIENGKLIVEDVKGYRDSSSAGYAKFVIKRKLMLHVHGIRITEI